ncbi:hypothetical protein O181_022415 [Austropuccinia psidii MF-1]|uniref:Uncharacterized protein n=1 Tax=Austropuccinia psidii MF-1 TaxID=1389203 RepID=A0A9Q3CHB9_9BASI|nr:hypothetical protein [Austropuccinia psidii MF-1]
MQKLETSSNITKNENIKINIGLRKTRKETQSQAPKDHKIETQKYLQKKITGAYHEEYEAEDEIRVLIPTKYKKTQQGKERDNENIGIISNKRNEEITKQDPQNMELKNKVKSKVNSPKPITEHVMKKVLEQKMNLNLEEILSM